MRFQIVRNILPVRQNHKGKKCAGREVFHLLLHFFGGVMSGQLLYMVRDIISPVIKFYRELSTLSTEFSTGCKGA